MGEAARQPAFEGGADETVGVETGRQAKRLAVDAVAPPEPDHETLAGCLVVAHGIDVARRIPAA